MQSAGLGQALSGFHTSKHNTACKQRIVPLRPLYSNVVTIKVVAFNQGNMAPLYNTQTSNIVLHVGSYGKPM